MNAPITHQSFFWGEEHTNVLRQKSLGASIMVSDFIDEVGGFVRDSEDQARLFLETHREGYFTNDHLLRQVARTVDIFERVHQAATALFLFYNAPSHRKVADDALNADRMSGREAAHNERHCLGGGGGGGVLSRSW